MEKQRLAVLRHQKENSNANLLWGPPLAHEMGLRVDESCKGLQSLGYFASPYPEGDGVTVSHPDYSPETALAEIRAHFPWIDITDAKIPVSKLCGEQTVECTILVPVEKLHLTHLIHTNSYRFIPAMGCDEYEEIHPWCEELSDPKDKILLRLPLIETTVTLPYSELFLANEYPDGMGPLLRRCAEYADRGLDLLRLDQCTYQQLERICSMAGQLLSGFHSAYVIPNDGPIKPQQYCHLVSPMQFTPNWLGLDTDRDLRRGLAVLAPIVHSPTGPEMFLRVRGAIRAAGQAFYILTWESRFLSLIFALDGLCAPKKKWAGLTHHAYIVVIAANGRAIYFNKWLRRFDEMYTKIRNPIVHHGTSFIELNDDAAKASSDLVSILLACVRTILKSSDPELQSPFDTFTEASFDTVQDLQNWAITELNTPEFQQIIEKYIEEKNASRPSSDKPLKLPRWS
jgi:hypothetical protein